jgi:flagellar motor switch/type III secretory pathway protein FliN
MTFSELFSKTASEFLACDVMFKLASISDEQSPFWKDSDYFVSQMNLSKEQMLTLKVSDAAANFVFRTALGDRSKETGYLKFKEMTELEANILNAFNEFLFKKIIGNFLTYPEIKVVDSKITDMESQIYLVLYIYGANDFEAGKIILSFPEFTVRGMVPVEYPENPIQIDYFNDSYVETDIIVGHSRITLDDVKNLDVEDIVILEKSNLYSMILKSHENLRININPDPNLVLNLDDEEDGEDTVNRKADNIWDTLEVDLSAEFDRVKIKLGDLRQVVEGLVIDIAPVARNKIFLNVEGKQIGAGELVIVGDNYGVKITEVNREVPDKPSNAAAVADTAQQQARSQHHAEEEIPQEAIDDSDFDFSDYEIEEDV